MREIDPEDVPGVVCAVDEPLDIPDTPKPLQAEFSLRSVAGDAVLMIRWQPGDYWVDIATFHSRHDAEFVLGLLNRE